MKARGWLGKWHGLLFLTAVAVLGGHYSVSAKASAQWAQLPYKYIIVDQDIRDVLVEFGRNLKVPVKLSPAVSAQRIYGTVAKTKARHAKDFLQNLCDGYGLVWYFDGSVIHISSEQEVDTEVVQLKQIKPETVKRRLKDLALSDPRFHVKMSPDGAMLSISGPPSYRLLVHNMVAALQGKSLFRPAREVKMKDSTAVRVFRGGS